MIPSKSGFTGKKISNIKRASNGVPYLHRFVSITELNSEDQTLISNGNCITNLETPKNNDLERSRK